MVKTIREFVDLIASGNPSRMLNAIKDELTAPTTDDKHPEGEDNGLPVSGTCTVATYPIYLAAATVKGFTINPFQRAADAVSGLMPFGADKANPSYLTPAPDLGSWQEIPADKMPGFCSKVMVVGQYEIWVDRTYPGGSNKFADYTPTRLIADFLLRCDTRHTVYDEAVRLGCQYVTSKTRSSTAVSPIAVLTRLDAAVQLNIQTLTWDLMDNIPEPSVLNNKSQHKRFAVLAKPETYEMTGEQIGRLVLSCEDGINKMAQVYKDNLAEFLSLTRFQVLHPIDTVGVFMRESSASSMVQSITNTIPTTYHFPVWLHDTILQRWYRISTGFTRVSEDTLPATRTVAGTLCGVYEVVYDSSARDRYTAKQLAWLISIVMQSQYIPMSDAIIAMRGCMDRINSMFAHLVTPEVVCELEAVPGTRIPDLSSDPGWANQVEAVISLSHSKTQAYIYSSLDSTITNSKTWPNKDFDISASISIGGDGIDPRVFANMLIAFSKSDMLYGWENVVAHDDELEDFVEPPAACVEFYSHVPHAYDPPIVTHPIPVYLKYADTLYALTYVGDSVCWGLADELDKDAEEVGEFFGGTLYCVSGQGGSFTNTEFTDVIRSTLSMFGDFSRAPTVYRYLYTIGNDDSWSRVGAPDEEHSIYVASVTQDTSLCYSTQTNLWSFTAQQLSAVNCSNKLIGLLLPNGMDVVPSTLVSTMLKSLQACILGLAKDTTGVLVPSSVKTPRGVALECVGPFFSVEYKGLHYTLDDGGLRICDEVPESTLTPELFMEFLTVWIEQMLAFPTGNGAYSELQKWGFNFSRVPEYPEREDVGAFLYFNNRYYFDLCGLDRRVPAEFSFPPKDTAPENIGVGLFLDCDGYRGIRLKDLAVLCSRISGIDSILAMAERDNVPCPESEEDAVTWYKSRPGGVAIQKKRNALMYTQKGTPMLAVWFPNGDITGWDGDGWGAAHAEGMENIWRIYYDKARADVIIDVETAKELIERCVIFIYNPPEGMYRYLRALKLMR